MTRTIDLPELSLVVLIGPSGAGKSTFAHAHFAPSEVLSSDHYRGVVCDDENDLSASEDAFDALHYVLRKRLARGRLTVIDATNVQPEARRPLVAIAREHHVFPVAIVLDVREDVCHARNAARPDRAFGKHVVRRQLAQMRRSIRALEREGFRKVHVLRDESVEVVRTRMWNDRKDDRGPFDIIGDVHGCRAELELLLEKLGYVKGDVWAHPAGRKAIFLGDLVDRGPDVPGVLRIAMSMHAAGTALCIPGNHENKLLKKLRGKNVKLTHGLAETIEQLGAEPAPFVAEVASFIDGLVSHYVLDGGQLVVAHAGLKETMHGRASGKVRSFALYGETTGESDEYGLPVRYPWAEEYRGRATVVYGHTPVPDAAWLNHTICVDTGCVFGGKLTALRWPERELVDVPAARVYCEPKKPLRSAMSVADDALDADDVLGKRIVDTRLSGRVTVREANAAAALEAMSRFAIDPRWLVYLPPTMSPAETTRRSELLEHPDEAFAYFAREGVARVVCEEKHMGSRAIAIVCKDEDAAEERFGVRALGAIYTRTGRAFFGEPAMEREVLARLSAAIAGAGLYEELASDWVVLDCELLPWSVKAQGLLKEQYAAVGAAADAALGLACAALERASARIDVSSLRAHTEARRDAVARYRRAWQPYCWSVTSVSDLRLAPFHMLASERAVHVDRDHAWHLEHIARVAERDPIVIATDHRFVDLADQSSIASAIAWWEELVARGGEGMVVKPIDFLTPRVQPAIKCRGPEYLRIIYGPEHTLPDQLERLRARHLGHKRSLAMRELALGVEGLERFVRREPLRRVHECVFAVLALESEPVDPRL